MAARKPAPPARSSPAQPKPQVSLPPRPTAPAVKGPTFGDRMATKMAAAPAQQAKMGLSLEQAMKRGNTFGEQQAGKMAAMEQAKRSMEIPPPAAMQAAAQQAIAQSQRAQQNMAPGTGGRGTLQQYEAMKQQQAGSNIPAFAQQAAQGALGRAPAGVPQYGPQTQPPPAILGNRGMAGGMGPMGPTGPGTQTGGPAPMGMGPTGPGGMAAMGAFKKGGAVKAKAFAKGGSVKATSMGSVKTTKPKMGSASSRGDGIAIRGKTRA